MKQMILILTFITACAVTFGQDDVGKLCQDTIYVKYNSSDGNMVNCKIDTISFETGATSYIMSEGLPRGLLLGTTILPWTTNQARAYNYGLAFVKVTKSNCEQSAYEMIGEELDQINNILLTDSTLIIDFNITDNCCCDFLCDITVDTAGILSLIVIPYWGSCACVCCFGLTYHLAVERFANTPKVKAVMINDNRKTIKPVRVE